MMGLLGIAAAHWFCTAPLDATGTSPLSLELTLQDDESFVALGEERAQREPVWITWRGNWTRIDGQLAMIGAALHEEPLEGTRDIVETRAFGTREEADVLFLAVIGGSAEPRTVRCLSYDLR